MKKKIFIILVMCLFLPTCMYMYMLDDWFADYSGKTYMSVDNGSVQYTVLYSKLNMHAHTHPKLLTDHFFHR